MGRTLRSRSRRALLWYATEGRCARCRQPLGPSFHADHKVPYSKDPVTNVHGMQALCAACNLQKGAGE